MKNKNLLYIVLGILGILSIPLLAMQFSSEMNWGPEDFLVMGALLLGTGFTYELVVKKFITAKYQVVAGILLLLALIWIWAELAVGIFTNWGS